MTAMSVTVLAACAPGSKTPASSSTTAGSGPASSEAVSPSRSTDSRPTTLTILVSTPDVALFNAFGTAFHSKNPNVTVKVTSQDFNSLVTNTPHILAGSDVPDFVRVASFGNLVTDHLLTNLDTYAKTYGWDKLAPIAVRVHPVGSRRHPTWVGVAVRSWSGLWAHRRLLQHRSRQSHRDDFGTYDARPV